MKANLKQRDLTNKGMRILVNPRTNALNDMPLDFSFS
jgi:hypothetical protein